MAPIADPRKHATLWSPSGLPLPMKLAIEVRVAATPTRAWKAATVYGSSVIGTDLPIPAPITLAEPNKIIAWANTAGGKLN